MKRTYYQDLGVSPQATQKEIERAFWQWQRGSCADYEGTRRAEKAYLNLSDPARRRLYDRRLGFRTHPAWIKVSPEPARNCFDRGQAMIREGRNRRALSLFRRAVALDRRTPLYRSYLGLLVARTGGSLREAVAHCRKAYEEAPEERRIVLNLAAIYKMAGLHRRAQGLRRQGSRRIPSFLS